MLDGTTVVRRGSGSLSISLKECPSSCQYFMTIRSNEESTINLALIPQLKALGTMVRKDYAEMLSQTATYDYLVQSSDRIVLDVYAVSGSAILTVEISDQSWTYEIAEAGHHTMLFRPCDLHLGQYLTMTTNQSNNLRSQMVLSQKKHIQLLPNSFPTKVTFPDSETQALFLVARSPGQG